MATAKNELNKLRKEMSEMADAFADMAKAMNDNAKAASKYTGESAERYKQSFKEARNLAVELSGFTQEEAKHAGSRAKIERKIAKTKQNQFQVLSKISNLQDYLLKAKGKEADAIKNALTYLVDTNKVMDKALDISGNLVEDFKRLENSNPFKGLADLVSDIPVINKLFSNMVTASEKFNDEMFESENRMKALSAGAKEYIKLMSKVLLVGIFTEAKKQIASMDILAVNLANNLAISKNEGIALTQEFTNQSKSLSHMGMTYKKIMQANIELAALQGVQTTFSKETASEFSILTKNLGISAEKSSQLLKMTKALGMEDASLSKSTMGMVKMKNSQLGIAISEKEVLNGIADISSNVALSMHAQGKNLANAVYQAKKLGFSMSQVEKTASSLLDFETSITHEMEAEMLIGRDLNLERARLAALNNDMGTVVKEMARNGVNQSSFSRMNAIQQKSIAQALGMTAKEMGDAFIERENLKRLGVKDIGGVSEIIKRMRAEGKSDKEIGDKIGNDRMLEAGKNRLMQDQLQDVLDKLAEKVMPFLIKVLQGLTSALNYLGLTGEGQNKVAKGTISTLGLGVAAKMATTSRAVGAASSVANMTRVAPAASAMTKASGGAIMNATGRTVYGAAASSAVKAGTATLANSGTALSKTASIASKGLKVARAGSRALGPIAMAAGVGFDAYNNFNNDKLTGGEAVLKTLDQNKYMALGAAVGTVLFPAVGTLVGAGIGGLADLFLPTIGDYDGTESASLEEQKRTNELLQANNNQLMKQTSELYEAISRARSVSIDGDLLTSNAGISNTTGNRNIL
jgi:hypothetical protein|tara:strand:- start:9350 stop:11764 length:2415 start_codon:yes stop_codon:yes gene_type:complete